MFNRKLKLSTIIIFFVCVVVLLSLLVTDLLISRTISENITTSTEEKARIVSRTVAKSNIVINGLDHRGNDAAIQEYTSEIQAASNVMFVVVMDMEGIRLSHPNPKMIGRHFVGGDEKEALQGKELISVSKGTLGESMRAFTPIYGASGEQVGAVAVGISLENLENALGAQRKSILLGTLIGLAVGILGSILLARYIKRILFGLEPFMIAKLLEERSTMLQSVREGIIAVDRKNRITLVNKSATGIYSKAGLAEPAIGMELSEYLPSSRLDKVMESGMPELDEEQLINGYPIIVNRVPLSVNGQVVGAISTFRDKSEINQLAEQLTGVKMYAEALRAQSHEFMNKLHVILGMVSMEMFDELKEFIRLIVANHNEEIGAVTGKIKDPVLAGFLMGKLSFAREQSVDLNIIAESVIPEPAEVETSQELITIVGNLIDNAIEAVAECGERTTDVILSYKSQRLSIQVTDSGPGIDQAIVDDIFQKGFSTKGSNRGYGLHLLKKSTEKLGGEIRLSGKLNASFQISIPYQSKEE